jgi:hypothetical protein
VLINYKLGFYVVLFLILCVPQKDEDWCFFWTIFPAIIPALGSFCLPFLASRDKWWLKFVRSRLFCCINIHKKVESVWLLQFVYNLLVSIVRFPREFSHIETESHSVIYWEGYSYPDWCVHKKLLSRDSL